MRHSLLLIALALLASGLFGQSSKEAFTQGLLKANEGNDAASIAHFSRAIQIKPDFADALLMRGGAYVRLGKYSEALNDLDKVIQFEPVPKAYSYRAYCFEKLGDIKRANEDYTVVIQAVPRHAMAYVGRARCNMAAKKYDLVMADLALALGIDPKSMEVRVLKVKVRLAQGDTVAVLSGIEDALTIDPSDPEMLTLRGQILHAKGQPKEAMKDFAKAIKSDPDNPAAYIARAEALLATHQSKAACKDLKEAVGLGSEQAKRLLEQHCGAQ